MNKNTIHQFKKELEAINLDEIHTSISQYQLRAIMQTSVDAIILSDTRGNILSWNNGAQKIFGYDEVDVLGKPLTLLIPDKYKEAHNKGMARVIKYGTTKITGTKTELEGIKKNGEIFPLELSLSCWEMDGNLFFGGIIRDITERKQFEHDLRERELTLKINNQKLAEANQKIDLNNKNLHALSIKLSKYLSPQLYNSIFSGEKDVKIETSRKELSICFSDIVGFTAKTENMDEQQLSLWLNNYLNDMAEIALRYEGTLDKFIGDSVMVFFGDPQTLGRQKDALKCVLMALEMRERAKYLNIDIRIGIHTGKCTVGNFGSDNRMDYTIVGGSVNLASRLESNSEPNQILISETTYHLVKDFVNCEARNPIRVKGIDRDITTYWVIEQTLNA